MYTGEGNREKHRMVKGERRSEREREDEVDTNGMTWKCGERLCEYDDDDDDD